MIARILRQLFSTPAELPAKHNAGASSQVHLCFVYHPDERADVEPLKQAVEKVGVECRLAPLGEPLLTSEWRRVVDNDIRTAFAVILFQSPKALNDQSVLARVQTAMASKKRIIPVRRKGAQFDSDDNLFANQSLTFQAVVTDNWYEDFFAEKILKLLPTLQTLTFLSYARSDSKIVGWVKDRLEGDGFRCWQDTNSIEGGILWDDEIERALTECTHTIFFVSKASLQSQNVKDEIGFARQLNKPIIPVIVDDTPEGSMPFRAHRYQAIRIHGYRQQGIEKLVAALSTR